MKRNLKRCNIFDKPRNLPEGKEMTQADLSNLLQQMANLQAMLQNMQMENRALKEKVDQMPINPNLVHPVMEELQSLNITYQTPQEINLDVFKSLPILDGNIAKYRIWREDVSRVNSRHFPLSPSGQEEFYAGFERL